MLSYLKDSNQLPASSDMPEEPNGTSHTTDYMTVSGHGQKVRKSTIVLVALFAVGALGVWYMVKKTTPATASAETNQDQVQLEAALAQLNTMQNEVDSQMNAVTGRFYQFNNVDQVAVDELQKNPFKREMDYSNEQDNSGSQEIEQIRQEAQIIAVGLELWSVTSTPKGICCMINDKVLYTGDVYKEMTVESIKDKTVTLSYKGIPVELKMD